MSSVQGKLLVIVMPVYEDAQASSRLFKELGSQYGDRIHVVAVDDGSVHQPVSVSWLKNAGVTGTVITLKRNEGHQRAIAVGLMPRTASATRSSASSPWTPMARTCRPVSAS
jgi:GT2 family glycosyltransferase